MKDSEFDDLLKTAKGPVLLPSSFRHGVWSRIKEQESEVPKRAAWFQPVLGLFLRPWGAVAGMAATVAVGVWLGSASVPGTEGSKQAYAESISPFAHPLGR